MTRMRPQRPPNVRGPKPGKTYLYHYTNREGYEGILASKSLRLSRATPESPLVMGDGVYFTRLSPDTDSKRILRNKNAPQTIMRRKLGLDRVQYYFAIPYDAVEPNCIKTTDGRDVCVKPILENALRLPVGTIYGEKHKYGSKVFNGEINDDVEKPISKPPIPVPPTNDTKKTTALLSWNTLFKTQIVAKDKRPEPCRENDPSGMGVCAVRIMHRLARWCQLHADGPFFVCLQEFLDPGDRMVSTLCGKTTVGCVTAILGPQALKMPILYNTRYHAPLRVDGVVFETKGPHHHVVLHPPTAGWVFGEQGRPFFACLFRDRANVTGLVVNLHAGHRRRTQEILNAVASDLQHNVRKANHAWAIVMGDFNAEVGDGKPRSFGAFGPSTNGQLAGPLANCCWSDGAYQPNRKPSLRYTQIWTFGKLRYRSMRVLDWGGADRHTFHSDHRPTEVFAE